VIDQAAQKRERPGNHQQPKQVPQHASNKCHFVSLCAALRANGQIGPQAALSRVYAGLDGESNEKL
jgi:hypothetical protein